MVLVGVALPANAEHPGQHLDLHISITDSEVVYEILLSTDLGHMIILNEFTEFRAARDEEKYYFIDKQRRAETRAAYAEFFKTRNPVTIDGVEVSPTMRSLEFVPNPLLAGDDDPYSFPPDARVIMVYPTAQPPRQVAMVWDLYPRDVSRAAFGLDSTLGVAAQLDAYDENKIITFTTDEPEVIWHAALRPIRERITPVIAAVKPLTVRVPLLSGAILLGWGVVLLSAFRRSRGADVRRRLLLYSLIPLVAAIGLYRVGTAAVRVPWGQSVHIPDPEEAAELFVELHSNVYEAFKCKTESDIYDVLATCVDGELLDQVYNEVYQSLILRDQGGAVARIQDVNVLETAIESAGIMPETNTIAFQVQARWQVQGLVYHWGHTHARTNEYKARYTVAQRGAAWKITAVEDGEQRRIIKEGDDPPSTVEEDPGDEF
ncbi:MAG: hypothetical protein ABIG44_11175 [Planctomycetota bacterium]